jgi:hypothetical protein
MGKRVNRAIAWGGAVLAIAGITFLFWVLTLGDAPYFQSEAPQPLEPRLVRLLGQATNNVTFRRYDLGGFIDHEWLWSFNIDSNRLQTIVHGLDLQPAASVPARFWQMPSSYWPRSVTPGTQAFQSDKFPGTERGPDGTYYFLVFQQPESRCFVWVKDNF